jgi:hypothetical protein
MKILRTIIWTEHVACVPDVINACKMSVGIWEGNILPETREKWVNTIKMYLTEIRYDSTVK